MARKSARFNRLAEVELHEAVAWYEERVPGLGLRFAAVVARKVAEALSAPDRWPLSAGSRRILLGRFPYALVYREVSNGGIEIVAVAHLRRRPAYWSKR